MANISPPNSENAEQLIADFDFSIRKYPYDCLRERTSLEKIDILIVTQMPLDYMHLID